MSNKSNGTAFEKEFAWLLSEHGFWVHCIKDNENGQPFDVIAAKNGETLVIDCKDCQNSSFHLSRMEENQINAMGLWQGCGNGEGMYAVRYRDGRIYLFPAGVLLEEKKGGLKFINEGQAKFYGALFDEWIERIDKL